MRYLLDTCVISELIRKNPEPRVVAWVDSLHESETYLSVITIGEIKRGVERLPASERQATIRAWLEQDLPMRFAGRILPIDTSVMFVWGQLMASLERAGRVLPAFDSLIAATALNGSLTVVTRNVADFSGVGVPVFNPWTAAAGSG